MSEQLTIQEQFEAFHEANPHVYAGLKRLALQAHAKGVRKTSIKVFVDVLRWEHWMTTTDANSDYKINDKYTSRYVRLLITEHPELEPLFELRTLRAA